VVDLRYGLILSLLVGGCVLRSTLGELDADGDTTSSSSNDAGGETSDDGDDASGGVEESSSGADEPPAPEEPPSPDEWVVPEECAAVAAESGYCLTIDIENVALIGLDTGSVCTFGASPGILRNPSFAWQGMRIVTCDDQAVTRIDVLTGEVEELGHGCSALTDLDDRLLVVSGHIMGNLEVYDDWEAIATNTPTQDLGFGIQGSRMWTDGEILFDAQHSTDTLWRHTLSGDRLDDLPLEGHDGWIDGIFVFEGTLHILTREGGTEVELRRFDPDTGASLGATVITGLTVPSGLQCRPGEGG
jgi:hypothetical protein